MMLLPLLLLAADAGPPAPCRDSERCRGTIYIDAPGESAVDVELAFYRDAQTGGQWAAFRKYAAPDAVLFTPQPTPAEEAMPTKEPPIAVQWWPAESYVSCDGTLAVNTGPWVRPGLSGYFTTVWVRQADGRYKWSVDHGDVLPAPRALPDPPKVRHASCKTRPIAVVYVPPAGAKVGSGVSADGTLSYHWSVNADGLRTVTAELWDGGKWVEVIRNVVASSGQ